MSSTNNPSIEDLIARVDELSEEVQYLRDCEAIRQAMYAYARGVDRADQDLLERSFHDDATDDHGNFKGGKRETLETLKRQR